MATAAAQMPLSAPLKTPMSATYPSELPSPTDPVPTLIKLEEGLVHGQKTPISPPLAYLDFLKTLSPKLVTPRSAERMSFPQRPSTLSSSDSSDTVVTLSSDATSVDSTPQLSRTSSIDSSASESSDKPATTTTPAAPPSGPRRSPRANLHFRSKSGQQRPNTISTIKGDPSMKISIPPISPFVRGASARTPRLQIPTSSPLTTDVPNSASLRTPLSAGALRTPMSAHSVRSPYRVMAISPKDTATYELKSPYAGGPTIKSGSFGLKQVVTRTVMYTNKIPPVVDAVPPNKKRRTE